MYQPLSTKTLASSRNAWIVILGVIGMAATVLSLSHGIHVNRVRTGSFMDMGTTQNNVLRSRRRSSLGMRGGGQVTSCLSGRMGDAFLLPDDEKTEPVPPPAKSATGVGFFKEMGRRANGILKFGTGTGINLTVKKEHNGMTLTTSAIRRFFKSPDEKADVVAVKGQGSKGKLGYWIGADSSFKLEGGVSVKKGLGEGKNVDLYLSSKLYKPQFLETEAVFTGKKIVRDATLS